MAVEEIFCAPGGGDADGESRQFADIRARCSSALVRGRCGLCAWRHKARAQAGPQGAAEVSGACMAKMRVSSLTNQPLNGSQPDWLLQCILGRKSVQELRTLSRFGSRYEKVSHAKAVCFLDQYLYENTPQRELLHPSERRRLMRREIQSPPASGKCSYRGYPPATAG